MSENMVSRNLEKANKFYEIGAKGVKLLLALKGNDFVVLRPKNNSKWKNVFGGSYSSDSTLESDYEQFTTRLIIDLNDMRDVWNRNRDLVQTITNDGSLEVGDELQYTRDKIVYRFKIIQKQSFSEAAKIIYQYTLSSIVETLEG